MKHLSDNKEQEDKHIQVFFDYEYLKLITGVRRSAITIQELSEVVSAKPDDMRSEYRDILVKSKPFVI